MDYRKLTKAELVAIVEAKDVDITKLNDLIKIKNAELQAPSDIAQKFEALGLHNKALTDALNTVISDTKNFLQLQASVTDIVSKSIDKSIALLKRG